MPELRTWWPDSMEEGLEGGGLRFFLRFDPGKVDRTLPGVSLPVLFSRFIGWARTGPSSTAIAEDGRESAAAAVVSAAALAAAVSVSLAKMHASGKRPSLAPRRPRPAAATAMDGPSSARHRALRAPDDGLRILSSKAQSSETVIHGASIGAGDDEPVIVARVATTQADDTADADAEHGQSEEARQQVEQLRELWLSLVEREQRLELEGLREQEAAERELESRVAAADMEARMLALKASSLEEENGRLRARLEELDDSRAELERAKEKLRAIEALVRGEREKARREAAALQARVEELERGGEERAAEAAALREANAVLEEENTELALRLRDAEQVAAEAAALRESNAQLEEENMEVALRLRDAEQVASSVATEAAALREANAAREEENTELARRLHNAEQVAALREANAAREEENTELARRLHNAEQVAAEAAALREANAAREEENTELARRLHNAEQVAAEAAALREANAALEEENMELALRLRDAEQVASSVRLAVEEHMVMVEEAKQLRETKESLTRQIEELRSDQYVHVEELVYLKWVNACLRHELSEHGLHPPCSEHQDAVVSGGMSAMELSKSMSFRSSERAKQLMLRYGHPGLDPALFSPRHESMDGDGERSYEPARSPAGTAATSTATTQGKKSGSRKLKFLGNIKKLLPGGKRSRSSHGGGRDGSSRGDAPTPMRSDEYLEKAMEWLSTNDVLDFDHSYETTPLSSCDRTPPSSGTTATTRGGAVQEDAELAAATLVRSRSDGGKSYGRYHSLGPDHPAADGTQKRGRRRRSAETRSPGTARA